MTYEAAKKRAAPYDKIVGELPEMRTETVHIAREAMRQRIPVYVLVNNRTEGNAPLTIQALIDRLTCAVAGDAPPPSCGPDPRGEPDSQDAPGVGPS
jgi:hypothetical protein